LASKNTNPLASLARFHFPSTYPCYILGQVFSDLASENAGLLASLVSDLKTFFPPLLDIYLNLVFFLKKRNKEEKKTFVLGSK
jgi:hypothetical protein